MIRIAKTAGFCFGVRNAITISEKAAEEVQGRVYTYGPLIHNHQAIADLEKKGVFAVDSMDEIPDGATVVIRAHGISEAEEAALRAHTFRVIDATCPFVKKIHRLVRDEKERRIIILGDPDHPEVKGIRGWCNEEPLIYRNLDEIKANPPKGPEACPGGYRLVAQTTFDQYNFSEIIEFCKGCVYNIVVCQTICTATLRHQEEALELASASDAVIVIGGKHSSNTRKLYDLCHSRCEQTYFVESAADVSSIRFGGSVKNVGITAGASTPDHTIQEVVRTMSESNEFLALLDESFQNEKGIELGDIVSGYVVQITENEIVFNIGSKCDGIMTKAEFGGDARALSEQVHVGDKMEVKVIKVTDTEVFLSALKAKQDKAYAIFEEAEENQTVLHGEAVEALENGIIVLCEGVRVFIPSSLSDVHRIDLKTLVGQEVDFRVIRVQRGRGRVMGDRRSVMNEQLEALRAETLKKLVPGTRIKGVVKNIMNYGAFIDLGGIDGMLHVSEMSWDFGARDPKRYLKAGEEIEVEIKSYDPETNRISLTRKFPETNPWIGAETKYAVGNIVEGKVARMTAFGAFVELEEGLDALIHISQISHKFVTKPADVLSIGQIVKAKVIDFDAEKKRISLSMRELEPEEEKEPAKTETAESETSAGNE